MSNHVDRFYAAVTALVSHDNIKQRLVRAFEIHLAEIDDDEMPTALRQEFTDLRHAMSGVEPLNGEGRIRATVRKMSMVEADRCAAMMLGIYAKLVRLSDELEELIPPADDQPVVPPFLVKTAG